MTVPYNHQVATSKPHVILRLLWRWKGSVWKAICLEYTIWIILYFIVYAIYRYALNLHSQHEFETYIRFFDNSMKFIPLDFMLGFFVTIVVNRWNFVFQNLGMIDNIALFTSNYVTGNDDIGRNLRRTIVRYCCLSQAMVFRDINMQVRRRFPTFEALVAAGFMQQHELDKLNSIENRYAKYWVPLNWALTHLNRAKKEGRVDSHMTEYMVAQEIRHFRSGLSLVWQHDWISIPVLYPQLVFLATHVYFIICIFSRQFIINRDTKADEADLHFPIMTSIQFIFYMGWMKVAMALLNPMGEDDDDYDCNFLLDRNLTLALGCADAYDDTPEIRNDIFWDQSQAQPLYSVQSALKNVHIFFGSATAAEEEANENNEEDITMVPHPVNERTHYRYRKRNVSVAPNSQMDSRRNTGVSVGMSGIANITRRFTNGTIGRSRQTSLNSFDGNVTNVEEQRSRAPSQTPGITMTDDQGHLNVYNNGRQQISHSYDSTGTNSFTEP